MIAANCLFGYVLFFKSSLKAVGFKENVSWASPAIILLDHNDELVYECVSHHEHGSGY